MIERIYWRLQGCSLRPHRIKRLATLSITLQNCPKTASNRRGTMSTNSISEKLQLGLHSPNGIEAKDWLRESSFLRESKGMSRHLKQDLEDAYHRLLALSGQVEDMISKAIKALTNRQLSLAAEVIDLDEEIDRVEVKIEEECLKMLALHQPVAADLRRVTTMMKINNDLERIADLACNVAERANDLQENVTFPIPELLNQMAMDATSMVRSSLNAFVNLDIELAYSVINNDDSIDEMNVGVIRELNDVMLQDSSWIPQAISCFSASRSLEQIADHAVNVAEDVIYMVNGVIVRHRHDQT